MASIRLGLGDCLQTHFIAPKRYLFPNETFFELHKLRLSLLRPPKVSPRKKSQIFAIKAVCRQFLTGLIRFFSYLLFLVISSLGYCQVVDVPSFLKTIPREDRKAIEDLFYLLFSYGDFAYTFFGIKPMCTIDYTMQYAQYVSRNEKFTRETYLARKGFDIWAKYEHLFPMLTLRMQLKESDQFGEYFSFILINKDQCLQIISKHITLVQKYYGQELNSEKFLEILCEGRFFQEHKIDTTILGLLLGYPEEDVLTFSKTITLDGLFSNLLCATPTPSFQVLKNSKSLWNKKQQKPCYLGLRKNALTPIKTPYFMSNREDKDLKEIKTQYASQKKNLVDFYYSNEFL